MNRLHRRRVGPVHVIQQQHERPAGRERGQAAGQPVEQPRPAQLRIGGRLGQRQRQQPGERAVEQPDHVAVRRERGADRLGARGFYQVTEDLQPRPEHRRRVGLRAAARRHHGPGGGCPAGQLAQYSTLPDPGAAAQEHEPSLPGSHGGQHAVQPGQHVVPARQRRSPGRHGGACAHRGRRLAPGRRRQRPRVQLGGVAQDQLLQPLQLSPRIDAEIRIQAVPRPLVGSQRVGLPAAPVQREHELRPQPFPVGVLGEHGLCLGHDRRRLAEIQLGFQPVLGGGQPQLFQPGTLGPGERGGQEFGERGPAPQRQRIAQQLARRGGLPVLQQPAALRREPGERGRVHRVGRDGEPPPRRAGRQQLGRLPRISPRL